MVDDTFGFAVKREMACILDEELEDNDFYEKWTGGVMPAWRVRVLVTKHLGEAWKRVQTRVDALEIFKKKGWAFVVGNANDNCVRMPELKDHSWAMSDVDEDFVEPVEDDEGAPEELATVEEEKEDGEEEGDESSEEEGEEVDPGPWEDTLAWRAMIEPPPIKAKLTIAHKFLTENGWDVGRIVKKERTGWAVKYPSERQQYIHELNMADYGPTGVWVVVEKG